MKTALFASFLFVLSLLCIAPVGGTAQAFNQPRSTADVESFTFQPSGSGAGGDTVGTLPSTVRVGNLTLVKRSDGKTGTTFGALQSSQGTGAGASLTASWKSDGVTITVTVVQGGDELPTAFANRAKQTIIEAKASFPPDA